MERFAKIINGFQPVIIFAKRSILVIWQGSEYSSSTVRNVSKYGVFSGPYFHVFSPNTGKHGPEKTPYLEIFRAV